MGLLKVKHKGNFNRVESFMNRMLRRDYLNILARYGEEGIQALSNNTPASSGKTADSWEYGIESENGKTTIYWYNTNENQGANIAILLIYGHGTQNGSYVQGIDFVTPVMQPIFDRMAQQIWNEVIE